MRTSPSTVSEIEEVVLARIRPTPEDGERIREVTDAILTKISDLAKERCLPAQTMLVGSAARGTWLAGDHDLDIFIAVPMGSELEDALNLARALAPEHEEKYAEHPYVHATIEGFDVDLVPCYFLENTSSLKSAVDRTPFHTRYVLGRIKGLEDQVLLLKQFMKGVGVYGSELKVGGFSGYLSELLVLRYGSFMGTLEGASRWRPREIIDLEGRGTLSHGEPLVVVDPVDPKRNVAAALTLDKMLQFAASARCFIKGPSLDFFFPGRIRPLADEELIKIMEERKSAFILLEISAPPVVQDILYPQLRKAEEAIRALLTRNGFSVMRSDVESTEGLAWVLFELDVWELPRIMRRFGPPIYEDDHLSRFISSHPQPISGPYVEGGRAVVEVKRKYTKAWDLLEGEMSKLSLGKHLAAEVQKGHRIYIGPTLVKIKAPELRIFLARYFSRRQGIC
jgi:tRNA nucleotidyltransferase (CCA-adding enzyme)